MLWSSTYLLCLCFVFTNMVARDLRYHTSFSCFLGDTCLLNNINKALCWYCTQREEWLNIHSFRKWEATSLHEWNDVLSFAFSSAIDGGLSGIFSPSNIWKKSASAEFISRVITTTNGTRVPPEALLGEELLYGNAPLCWVCPHKPAASASQKWTLFFHTTIDMVSSCLF